MENVVWDESYSVHVRALDEQHQQLITMINALIGLSEVSVDSEAISDALTEMTKYAQYHFSKEEQYMLEYGFPGYQSHKREHREFKRKAADICVDAMKNKATVPMEICKYLKRWCVNHIFKSDQVYGRFFKDKDIQ